VHLPLSVGRSRHRCHREYTTSVRKDAPWCPSNIEFIRRINGLDSIEQVRETVFGAVISFWVWATCIWVRRSARRWTPRHRLVTTKYNPARTWTRRMRSASGARTMRLRHGRARRLQLSAAPCRCGTVRQTRDFRDGKPWLLRFFDQIRFYPVSEAELLSCGGFSARTVRAGEWRERRSAEQYNAFLRVHCGRRSRRSSHTQQSAFEASASAGAMPVRRNMRATLRWRIRRARVRSICRQWASGRCTSGGNCVEGAGGGRRSSAVR
jgi:urea carboxylase